MRKMFWGDILSRATPVVPTIVLYDIYVGSFNAENFC